MIPHIDNVINTEFQFVTSFQNIWLIAQVLTDQFPGDSDAFGNSFTWPMIVRLKKQALAAASFPTSRQLSKLPPELRAAVLQSPLRCGYIYVDGTIVEA